MYTIYNKKIMFNVNRNEKINRPDIIIFFFLKALAVGRLFIYLLLFFCKIHVQQND